MSENSIYEWLIKQTPVIFVLGLVIYGLVRQVLKLEKKLEDKDQKLYDLSKDVVVLASHWEEWLSDNDFKNGYEKILSKLDEIKDIVKDVRGGKI